MSKPKQALYDNLDKNEELANELDQQIRDTKDDDWRSTHIKRRKVEIAIRQVLESNGINDELMLSKVFDIVSNQKKIILSIIL